MAKNDSAAATPLPHQGPIDAQPPATTFEDGRSLAEIPAEQAGALASVAREEWEVKGAIVMSKKFPRNEMVAYNKLLKACERPRLAEEAIYSYPRGGQQIEGPSINLATAAAGYWGNIRSGHRIVSDTEEQVHIMGFAWDMETNRFESYEDKFQKLIQRKINGKAEWVRPDERDLRELVNRRGAILERNALLRVIPRDVIEEALDKCKETMKLAASGQLKQDPKKTIRSLVAAFDQVGVNAEMLMKHLGHDLEILTADEVAQLRGIWKSISDGNSRREEHFELPKPKTTAEKGSISMSQIGPKKDEAPPATK
jgi:hypothetical protein